MEIYFFTGMASGYILQLGFTQDIFLGQLGVSGVLVFFKTCYFFNTGGIFRNQGAFPNMESLAMQK